MTALILYFQNYLDDFNIYTNQLADGQRIKYLVSQRDKYLLGNNTLLEAAMNAYYRLSWVCCSLGKPMVNGLTKFNLIRKYDIDQDRHF